VVRRVRMANRSAEAFLPLETLCGLSCVVPRRVGSGRRAVSEAMPVMLAGARAEEAGASR